MTWKKYTYETEKRRFFETQILKFEDIVRAIVNGVLDNPDDVSDAVQETFLAAWENLDRLAKRSSAGPWIRIIARNTAIDALRKNRREESIHISLSQPMEMYWDTDATLGDCLADPEPGPEELCIIRAELKKWHQAYRMLPENYRLSLYYRYYMQLGTDEISSRMGISRQAQTAACYRAKKAMRRNFAAIENTLSGTASRRI